MADSRASSAKRPPTEHYVSVPRTGRERAPRPGMDRERRREALLAYVLLAPAGVILFVFHLFPLLYGAYISLHNWRLTNRGFIGLENYELLLTDPDWWSSLINSLYYALGTVPVQLVLGLVIATLLFGRLAGGTVYRLFYFMPYITPMAAVGVVWAWMFNANSGVVNATLQSLGLGTPRWLLEPTGVGKLISTALGWDVPAFLHGPSLALVAIMIVTVWYYVGFHTVVYHSGLSNIPTEVLDAAQIDGVGWWERLRYILGPLLSPTTLFLSTVAFIGSFQAITLIYVMTGMGWGASGASGNPLGTTRVALLYIFDYFYTYTQVGYAMAGAVVLFLITLVLTVLHMRAQRRRVFYIGGDEQ